MINNLGDFIKEKVDRKSKVSGMNISNITKQFGITYQYLHDIENGKRIPSSSLMKTMIDVLDLSEPEKIELYDLASESHKVRKIPADIEEYIITNDDAKNEIRKLISKTREVK